MDLGRLQTGATVSFARAATGEWGIEIAGAAAPRILQPKPAKFEVFRTEEDIRPLAAGYKTVQKSANGIDAQAEIAYGENVVFHVKDHWSLSGEVLSVRRKVDVTGNAPGGFYSSVVFTIDPSIGWSDVNYLAPGALYGDPTYDGDRSPGGTQNYAARRFQMREDILPAPLFALSFNNGASVAVLDPSPRGDTTVEETRLTKPVHDRCAVAVRRARGLAGGRQPHRVRLLVSRYDEQLRGRPRGAPAGLTVDSALSSDRSGSGPQLSGELSLRAERIVPGCDAQRVAMGVEHSEPSRLHTLTSSRCAGF